MFSDADLERFYREAASSQSVDAGPVLEHIRSFQTVILWGAANFGAQVGAFLAKQGIRVETYWDVRASELQEVNGLPVVPPFTGEHDPEKTLVILCITNNVIKLNLWNQLRKRGYRNAFFPRATIR